MGNFSSKFEDEVPQDLMEKPTTSLPSTPVPATEGPKISTFNELDPRSPTAEIVRTPIQFTTEIPLQKKLLQELIDDPRSPTTEFERTPIVVSEKTIPAKLHNKNLDNARKQLAIATTDAKMLHFQQKTSPKLLESSPIAQKGENKRKSMAGVLETNLDFKETDLDEVIQKKLECVSLEDFNKSIGVYEEVDVDPRSPTVSFARTPLQVLKKVGEIELNDTKNLDSDDEENALKDELTVVKNFDKKLTNLIYEDENVELIQKPIKSKENNCRTPLGLRNCNEQPSKIVTKLRVSDRPLKKQVSSKIPVFKETRNKKLLQCENTPPTNIQESTNRNKPKKSQWDADRTLVI